MNINSKKTDFFDNDGNELRIGDRIKVPDNPDISPWDTGTIEYHPEKIGEESIRGKARTGYFFVGKFSITPLEFYYDAGYADEVEKL